MRDLTEQRWCNWTVQHEVTIEELYFLDSLPSTDRRRTRCRSDRRFIFILVGIRIRPKWVIGLQDRDAIVCI